MKYQYAIVRYVPDAVREERLNVGVLLLTRDGLRARLLGSGQTARLGRLSTRRDFRFLRSLEGWLNSPSREEQLSIEGRPEPWSLERLLESLPEWAGSIQFSPFRGGVTTNPEGLLDSLFGRYVAVPPSPRIVDTERRSLRAFAGRAMRTAMSDVFPRRNPLNYVRRDEYVPGKLETHQFDYVLRNGRPLYLTQAISFNVADVSSLRTQVDATAWAVTDVRKEAKVPIAILTSGSRQTDLRRLTEDMFPAIGARVVGEDQRQVWASDFARALRRMKTSGAL